jgi:hypothetical protein
MEEQKEDMDRAIRQKPMGLVHLYTISEISTILNDVENIVRML